AQQLRSLGADNLLPGSARLGVLAVALRAAGCAAGNMDLARTERRAQARAAQSAAGRLLRIPQRQQHGTVSPRGAHSLPLPRPTRPVHGRAGPLAGVLGAGGAYLGLSR